MKIVSKLKVTFKKIEKWTEDHIDEICNGIMIVSSIAVPIGVWYWQYKHIDVKPNDIVRYSNGWMLLDAYEPNLYWPTKHGLSVEEIKQVGELIEREGISTGEALLSLGLLRSNC